MEGENKIPEMSIAELADILGGTIKYDDANKVIVFLGMLSAYTESDQLNICFMGASSSGKSYVSKEVSNFFPAEDVLDFAGVTPTALKYYNAVHDEYDNTDHVDFERKIIVFSEMPHSQILANLRPLLSHDNKEIEFLVTETASKEKKFGARRIIMRGYPSVTFCSASARLNEQEVTRCLLLSPEVSTEKVEAGMDTVGKKSADIDEYKAGVAADPRREQLKHRIECIKALNIKNIKVPNNGEIVARFMSIVKRPLPRHQRDVSHLFSLIKAVAILNAGNRFDEKGVVVANKDDINAAFDLWQAISESQLLGVPPAILGFYKTYILAPYNDKISAGIDPEDENGVTKKEMTDRYFALNGTPPNDDELKRTILKTLESAGIISINKCQNDKRLLLITPLVGVKIDSMDKSVSSNQSNDSAPEDNALGEIDSDGESLDAWAERYEAQQKLRDNSS